MAIEFDQLRRAMLAEARAQSSPPPPPAPLASAPRAPVPPPLFDDDPGVAHCGLQLPARENASECIVSPPSLPTALYVPDAVTPAHEAALLHLFDTAPWTRLRARSLQQYGGSPSAAGLENATPLPRFLSALCASLVSAGVFDADAPPNHVLVNCYAADEGIVAHTDGPCYLPVVATLSLGEDAVMRYSALRRAEDTGADDAVRVAGVGDVVLRARSLVVTRDALYTAHAHEIVADADARIGSVLFNGAASGASAGGIVSRTHTRVSITLRHAWTTEEVAAREEGVS